MRYGLGSGLGLDPNPNPNPHPDLSLWTMASMLRVASEKLNELPVPTWVR